MDINIIEIALAIILIFMIISVTFLIKSKETFSKILFFGFVIVVDCGSHCTVCSLYESEYVYRCCDYDGHSWIYGCAVLRRISKKEGGVMMIVLSNVCIVAALIVMTCGIIGLLRWQDFYRRLLYVALVDTIGVILLLLGLVLRQNDLFIALKFLFLVVCIFFTAPIISHKLGRSAYKSLHRGEVEEIDE